MRMHTAYIVVAGEGVVDVLGVDCLLGGFVYTYLLSVWLPYQ